MNGNASIKEDESRMSQCKLDDFMRVKSLLGKIAFTWYRKKGRLPIEYNDLLHDAYLKFFEIIDHYDPEIGQLETFLSISINRFLAQKIQREYRFQNLFESDNGLDTECPIDIQGLLELKQCLERLATISESFVDMIVNGIPPKLKKLCDRKEVQRKAKFSESACCKDEFKLPKSLLNNYFGKKTMSKLGSALYYINKG